MSLNTRLLPELADHLCRVPRPNLISMQGVRAPMSKVSDVVLRGHEGELFGRLYTPITICRPLSPMVLFLHGGGWSRGDVYDYDIPCRALAREAQCSVLYVDYRLVPGHPFPAALLDAYAVASDLATGLAAEWGCDGARMAVVGDSAGGNIAAALCLMARDAGGPNFLHQVLIYPALDAVRDSPSNFTNSSDPMISTSEVVAAYTQYAGSTDLKDEWLSPLHASSLADLPSATIFAAELDPLYDDSVIYSAKLNASGTTSECIVLKGMPHMSFHMRGISASAERIYRDIGSRLVERFRT